MPHRLMICAGEASGDYLASLLIQTLKKSLPSCHFYGMAGDLAKQAGMDVELAIANLPGMGLWELVKDFSKLHQTFVDCCYLLRHRRPDALIVIDYPGFNLKLATKAHALGIPVIYYVSPKIWAWGKGRLEHIKKTVDHMAVVFPFEVPIYEQAGIPVSDVGHPLCKQLQPKPKALSETKKDRCITIMPGSRPHELERMMPIFIDCMEKWLKLHPETQFLIPKAPNLKPSIWLTYQAKCSHLPITWLEGQAQRALASAKLAWITSGTASLEAALIGVPHVVCYKVSRITAWYFKRKLTIEHVSLPNLILKKGWVPELLQDAAHPQNILNASEKLLSSYGAKQHNQHTKDLWEALSGKKIPWASVIKSVLGN